MENGQFIVEALQVDGHTVKVINVVTTCIKIYNAICGAEIEVTT